MATIRDVAQDAGVSISTVSHVINETRYVSPETRARVLDAIARLRYRHNRLASSLRHQRTQTLGVLLPNSDNPFFARVLAGIESASYERGYNIILGNAHEDARRELDYLQVLLSRQVDGILLISTGAFAESLALLAQNAVPVVMVDRSANLEHVDEIFTANEVGGRLATEYLLRLGHRRIGCITGPSHLTPSAHRVEGYRQALIAAGIQPNERLMIAADFQHSGGYVGAQTLLAQPQPPSAIFACNDLMAVGVLYAAHEAGLRVPQDLSLIGYDDIPLASYAIPRLTTISQPGEDLGRAAVDQLIERLKHPRAAARHTMLPVQLVERDSCAPYVKGK